MRAHLGQPATLVALTAVTAVLVLIGPFGTLDSLGVAGRAGYWAAVVFATYASGAAIEITLSPRLQARATALRVGVIAAATALAVTAVVLLLNVVLLGTLPDVTGAAGTLLTIAAIAAIASAALQIAGAAPPGTGAQAPDEPPPLLDRLPLDKRGPLVALSVEDHYVRIRTTRGEDMVLMRLTDAIREAAPTPGLRVHRSHWVAIAGVANARRDGDRAILKMIAGGDIPASRSHIPALRQAGLLPR
jgi:DNA-binding LytR/AlgR family response regulator